MKQANLLVLNTLISYSGFLFNAIAGILLIRFLLATLGTNDYGIYTALAASSALLAVIQAAVSDGARRHMSIEVGSGDAKALASVFNCTILLMLSAAVVVLVVGFLAADSVIAVVNVPAERMPACRFAYTASVISIAASACVVPWQAFLTSRQQLGLISIVSTIQPIATIFGLGLMNFLDGDPIAVFSGIVLSITVASGLAKVIYCIYKNPLSIPNLASIRWSDMRSITQFGGWIMFEICAVAMREKGSLLLMAAYFGPALTTAYDVALRLGNRFASLSGSLTSAVAPAITNAEGRGETAMAITLGDVLSRYSAYLGICFLVPFLLETETVLSLLIGISSPELVLFARIVMVGRFIGNLSWGDGIVAKSQNRIAVISIGLTLPFSIAFPIVWGIFHYGWQSSVVLPIAMLAVTAWGSIWFRPWYIRKLNGLKWGTFYKDVIIRVLLPIVVATFATLVPWLSLPTGLFRLMTVGLLFNAVAMATIWNWGIEAKERDRLKKLVSSGISNFNSNRSTTVI